MRRACFFVLAVLAPWLSTAAGVFTIDTGGNGSLLIVAPFARRYGLVERYHAVIPYGSVSLTATHGVLCRVGEVAINGRDGRPVVRVSQPLGRISLQQGGYDADRYVLWRPSRPHGDICSSTQTGSIKEGTP